jgi:hypothetical protein
MAVLRSTHTVTSNNAVESDAHPALRASVRAPQRELWATSEQERHDSP